jgi:hypothetical protein
MASLADMMYGTAQNAAQEQGAGLAQSAQAGAGLAMKQQELDMQTQQMQMKMQSLQQAKIQKYYDWQMGATKITNASDRQNYLNSGVGFGQAMGLPAEVLNPDGVKRLGTDENMQRVATLDTLVTNGQMSAADAIDLSTNPLKQDKFMQVAKTPLEMINKRPDLTASQEFALKQSQAANEAELNRQNALKVAATKAGAGQNFKPKDVIDEQKNQAAQLAPLTKKQAEVAPMLDARDRIATALQKDPTGASVTPQDLSAVVFPLLHGALGRVNEVEINKVLNMPGLAGMTQQQITDKMVGGVNPKAASAIMQWAEDSAKNIDQQVMTHADSIKKSINALPGRTQEQKDALLSGLPDLAKPVYRERPGAAPTVNFMGHDWTPQQLRDTITKNPNSPNAIKAKAALTAAGV